jgi:exosortase/archaeosortase family protein
LRSRWEAASATTQARVRVSILLLACGSAYYYSLSSLLQTLGFETPLAYLALVPLISCALAWFHRNPTRPEPAINDRHLDYIVGLPLLAVAISINEFLPKSQSVLFWLRRMDLLSFPFFVAGLVAIIFGTRTLWRQKVAVLYLFLAWPWPYTTILLGTLDGFTNVTIAGLTAALKVVHLGTPIGPASSGLFQITHHGVSFPVSVVTACSGVDGMVGFFLVGAAFACVVRGPRLRKAIWLACGLFLLWVTNLGRLLLIFWAGRKYGEQVALSVLHPIAGLVIFNIGVLLMVLLLKPMGLSLRRLSSTDWIPPHPPKGSKPPPLFMAAALVVAVTVLLNVNNTSLKSFDIVAGAAGEPKLSSFLADPATPVGWQRQFAEEFFNGKSLFGNSSRWFRYEYFDQGGGDLSANVPITADVINAPNVSSFGAYGVEACYDFHGYKLRDVAQISLGHGINGQSLSYTTQSGEDWSIVYWIWPVRNGAQTRYERVILYMQNTRFEQIRISGSNPDVKGLSGGLNPNNSLDERLIVNRDFLTAFGQEIVTGQTQVELDNASIGQVSPPGAITAAAAKPPPGGARFLSKLPPAAKARRHSVEPAGVVPAAQPPADPLAGQPGHRTPQQVEARIHALMQRSQHHTSTAGR